MHAVCLKKCLLSSKFAIIFEKAICSSYLHDTQVGENDRLLQAKDISPFLLRVHMFASDHSLGSHPCQ